MRLLQVLPAFLNCQCVSIRKKRKMMGSHFAGKSFMLHEIQIWLIYAKLVSGLLTAFGDFDMASEPTAEIVCLLHISPAGKGL
jgi:hypothetical protein